MDSFCELFGVPRWLRQATRLMYALELSIVDDALVVKQVRLLAGGLHSKVRAVLKTSAHIQDIGRTAWLLMAAGRVKVQGAQGVSKSQHAHLPIQQAVSMDCTLLVIVAVVVHGHIALTSSSVCTLQLQELLSQPSPPV